MPSHDTAQRRKSQRAGRQRGVTIYIAAAELKAAGIDPAEPAPYYRVWPGDHRGMRLRFYRDAT
jgi:hypothetical protein